MSKFKPLPLVYIASPYSPQTWYGKLPIVRNIIKYVRFKQINKLIAILIQQESCAFIAPITQSHLIGKYLPYNDGGFKKWAEIDLSYISKCDKLYVMKMKGWDTSIGVQAEIEYAKKRKIPTIYVEV